MSSALDELDSIVNDLSNLSRGLSGFDSDDDPDSTLVQSYSISTSTSLDSVSSPRGPTPLPPRGQSDFGLNRFQAPQPPPPAINNSAKPTLQRQPAPPPADVSTLSVQQIQNEAAMLQATTPRAQSTMMPVPRPPPPLVMAVSPPPPPAAAAAVQPVKPVQPIINSPLPPPVVKPIPVQQQAPLVVPLPPPPPAQPAQSTYALPPPPAASGARNTSQNPLLPQLPPPPPADLLAITSLMQATAPSVLLPPPPTTSVRRIPVTNSLGPLTAEKAAQLAREDKAIIKITNVDGSLNKTVEISLALSGLELLQLVNTKLQLQGADYFGLAWPSRAYDKFLDPSRPIREQDIPPQLIYKVRFMKVPRLFDQSLAIQLYWMQVKNHVLKGLYPITDYLGVKLGALHLQILNGDFDPKRHVPGFFKQLNDLSVFLPALLMERYKLQYWERRLLTQYAKYKGLTESQAQTEYIRVARKSPSFGASIFEVRAGAHALFGIAEDGLLLSTKKNSMCGDWTFYPFEQLLAYNRTSIGLTFQTKEVVNIGLHDDQAEAALALIHDYYSLFRVALDSSFIPDPYLPSKDIFEFPPKRVMLSSFPSRLELFKEAYQRSVLEANTRPLLIVLENIDRDLDEGRNCDIFDLENADLDDNQFLLIRKALIDTFMFKPVAGQIFVENFTVTELRLAGNHRLSAAALESLSPLFNTAFPARILNLSNLQKLSKDHAKAITSVLQQARRLDSLLINDTELGDSAALMILKSIKTNVLFRQLNLARTGLTDGFFFPLALIIQGHPSLADIDLAGNSVSDDGLKKIVEGSKSSRSLIRLCLSSTKVKSHAVKRLLDVVVAKGRPNHLEFANTKLSLKTAQKMAALLQLTATPGNLYYLDVHNTQITKKGAMAIVAALDTNRTLETLAIGSNDLDKEFMVTLANSLRNNTKLRLLSLKGSSLGSDGYELLGQLLRANTSLAELDISQNTLSGSDLKTISDNLIYNHSLNALNISGNNKIGMEGISALFGVFARNGNSTLTKVIMDGCAVGDAGAKKIAEAIFQNNSLERLTLRNNDITSAGLRPFLTAFDRNERLRSLQLEKNPLNLGASPDLVDALVCVAATGRQVIVDEDVRALKDPNKATSARKK